MSDNFHKTAVLKKRIVNLSLTGLHYQLMGAAPVPKFVRSLALDFQSLQSLQRNDLFFKFCGDCWAGRSGEEVRTSPFSSLLDPLP